jgi:hypothetical protein
VIFDDDPSTIGKKRNYTPGRQLEKLLGDKPLSGPQEHAPVHLPGEPGRDSSNAVPLGHRGPLPAVKTIENFRTTVVASHALESVRRDHWKKRAAFLVILAVISGASFWAWQEHQRDKAESRLTPISNEFADPANRSLIEGATLPEDDAEVVSARDFLKEKIFPATRWEDWLPHIRLPEQVEPIFRGYYAGHEFQSLAKTQIHATRLSRTPAGKFVVFLLDHPVQQVAMVEIGGDGPRFDWEILTNQPLREWEAFVKSKPSAPTTLPVALSRCYVREDSLTDQELPNRAELVGVRVTMPGHPLVLFSAVPLSSPLGQSLAKKLPWEHEDKTMLARVTLSFSPEHAAMENRIVLHEEPTPGWNRLPAPPAGGVAPLTPER